ncbi:MAG: amidohydrolase [Cellvibrionaceae bacterium]
MKTITRLSLPALLMAMTAACTETVETSIASELADSVYLNGQVYTADNNQSIAEAIAIKDDEIIFVGSSEQARSFVGDETLVQDLDGKLLMPGLHDVHIHPLGIVKLDVCDFDSEPHSLDAMVPVLQECISRYDIKPGEWLMVEQWAFTQGNEPSAKYPTLRAALDGVSTEVPVFLLGNDGHHAAVNSAALATAKNSKGETVGINATTLKTEFSDYRELIGKDASGEPDGSLTETARLLVAIDPSRLLGSNVPQEAMPRIAKKLASNGITSVQDAAAEPSSLRLYENLYDQGEHTFRLTAALYPHFSDYASEVGHYDIDAILKDFAVAREKFSNHPVIKADAAKVFMDGVIEGNPLVKPATLPNAAQLEHYHQPIFDYNASEQQLTLNGYVDQQGDVCLSARADQDRFDDETELRVFISQHGFSPSQCEFNNGILEQPEEFLKAYIQALDKNDYTIHAHAIGDRAVRTAIEAFELAKKVNGDSNRPHNIGHAQIVNSDDFQRAAALGLYVTMTYAWINPEVAYDATVTPFIDAIAGLDDLYNPKHYTFTNSYPAKSLKDAGVVLAAGSDAPVDTREPRPFVNIEQAVTRGGEGDVVWNASEQLDILSIIDAYTINGARALRQSELVGSLEPGKKADFIVLDQNIIDLARTDRADLIDQTRVLTTVFNGDVIHRAN